MSRGRFKVSEELLLSLLCMPEGAAMLSASADERGDVTFVVAHDSLPESSSIIDVDPQFETVDGAARFKGWGLPAAT